MNTQAISYQHTDADALGRAIAARLSEGADSLPHDISERLKAARALAVSRRKIVSTAQVASSISFTGGEAALQFGGPEDGLWSRIGAVLPLIALVVGLFTIAAMQDDFRAREAAEVDAELLIDELPPAAFTDPGFAHFLRMQQSN